ERTQRHVVRSARTQQGAQAVLDDLALLFLQSLSAPTQLLVVARGAPHFDVQAHVAFAHGGPQRTHCYVSGVTAAPGRLNGLFHAIQVLLVRVALNFVDQGCLAGKIVVHDALAQTQLLADLRQRRRAEALAREALCRRIQDGCHTWVVPIHAARRRAVVLGLLVHGVELLGRGIYSRHRFYWAVSTGRSRVTLFSSSSRGRSSKPNRTVVRNITPGYDVVNCRRLRSGRLTVVTPAPYNLSPPMRTRTVGRGAKKPRWPN